MTETQKSLQLSVKYCISKDSALWILIYKWETDALISYFIVLPGFTGNQFKDNMTNSISYLFRTAFLK